MAGYVTAVSSEVVLDSSISHGIVTAVSAEVIVRSSVLHGIVTSTNINVLFTDDRTHVRVAMQALCVIADSPTGYKARTQAVWLE